MSPNQRRLILLIVLLVLLILFAIFVWPWGGACPPPEPQPTPPDAASPAPTDVRTGPEDVPPTAPDTVAVLHPEDPVQVAVTPVLPERSAASQDDGHLRFFEVELRYNETADTDRLIGSRSVGTQDAVVRPGLVDACRSDRFVVSFARTTFPLEGSLRGRVPADIGDQIGEGLRAAVNGEARTWWFDKPSRDGETLQVRPAALCHVVSELQSAVNGALRRNQLPPAPVAVTRVCPAMQVGIEPTETMLKWHVERLGAKPPAGTVTEGPYVDVALVDSGVAGAVPGVVQAAGPVPPGVSPDTQLAHGTAMALLMQPILPPSLGRITSYRVFDEAREATPARIARAIDMALHDETRPAGRPLVINLSLGWPPELSRPRVLSVTPSAPAGVVSACRVEEAPVGAEVRYMLAAAREADAANSPILAVAAIGNRPGEPDAWPDLYGSLDRGYGPTQASDPCNPSVRPSWFFPAEWSRIGACRRQNGVFTPGRSVVVPVGTTDPHPEERPGVPSIPEADPPLVAPGEHVYAALYGAGGAVEPIADGPFVFPSPWSGTSVGAALTSAVAARAQAELGMAKRTPLRWVELERLLWLTGVDTGRASLVPGVGARRIDACRLTEALALSGRTEADAPPAAAACRELLTCVAGHGDEPPLSAAVVNACRNPADTCLASSACGAGAPVEPTLPGDVLEAGNPVVVPAPEDLNPVECTAALCPYDQTPDAYSLGAVSPMPWGDGCPDCLGKLTSAQVMTFRFDLNPKLTGSTWEKAWVEFTGPTSKASIDLEPYTGGFTAWGPGYSTTIEGVRSSAFPLDAAGLKSSKAVLVSIITPVAGRSYRDESPLYLVSGL